MKPIAKGRIVDVGDISTVDPDGMTNHHMAVLVVFDSMTDFRKAVQHGCIDAELFAPGSQSETSEP